MDYDYQRVYGLLSLYRKGEVSIVVTWNVYHNFGTMEVTGTRVEVWTDHWTMADCAVLKLSISDTQDLVNRVSNDLGWGDAIWFTNNRLLKGFLMIVGIPAIALAATGLFHKIFSPGWRWKEGKYIFVSIFDLEGDHQKDAWIEGLKSISEFTIKSVTIGAKVSVGLVEAIYCGLKYIASAAISQ